MTILTSKWKLSVVTLFLTSFHTSHALANKDLAKHEQFESDFIYLGAQIGSIRYQHGCEPWAVNCDKRDTAFSGLIGYQFKNNYFIESALMDLGDVNATYFESGINVPYQGKMKAWDAAIGYDLELSDNFYTFAKVGVLNWYGETQSPSQKRKDDGFTTTASLGLKYNFAENWQARLTYQYINDLGSQKIGSSNGHIGWLGLSYQFKRKKQTDPQHIVPAAKPQQTTKEKSIQIPTVKELTKVVAEESITTLFAFDSSYFVPSTEFNEFLTHIKSYPTTQITIKAYTDSKGSAEYNNRLSKQRAEAIKNYLANHGIDESRITVAFFGETHPIMDNDTEDHRKHNRRAVVTSSEIEVRINKEVQ